MYSGNILTSEPERFLISPPSLKRMASQEMALVLHQYRAQHYREYRKLSNFDFEPEDIIDVMPAISKVIKECILDPVGISIYKWCIYHDEYIFDGNLRDGLLTCIDKFVLKPDGNINFRSSAKNIVMGNKLNTRYKFNFASLYCLAEDVGNIWPEVRDDPMVIECAEENPMVHYWVRVVLGESPQFPVLENMSWLSIEYIWNTLSAEEQVSVAKELIEAQFTETSIEFFLLRLNKTQLRRVMEQINVGEMMSGTFLRKKCHCSEILTAWNYIKYFISPLKFQEIFFGVFEKNYIMCSNKFCATLFNIWINAEDHLKRSFLNNGEALKRIFQKLNFMRSAREYSDLFYDMRFFHAVLTELDFQSRNSLWCEFWPNLIVGARLSYLDEIMRLCFNNDNEITQFKERDMLDFNKIHKFCQLCFSCGFMPELNEYLNYCSSDIHYVTAVKQQILNEKQLRFVFNRFIIFFVSRSEIFVKFDQFIDSAFFDENEARQYKKNLLESNKRMKEVLASADKAKLSMMGWL